MRQDWWLGLTLLVAGCGASARTTQAPPQRGPGLRELGAIALPEVEGRIDHLAIDTKRMRLFVAALENDTLEVVDLKKGERERQIRDLAEPQGVLYLAEFDRVVVSNGESGMLDVFDGETLERKASIDVGKDADNLRFDPRTKEVLVAQGSGAIVFVDPRTWAIKRRFALTSHPEAFEISVSNDEILVNTPSTAQVAVLDRQGKRPENIWILGQAGGNYPMALIEDDHQLLVGCRNPARLLSYDTNTAEQRLSVELSGDCDDIFYDAEHRRVFVSCGAGFIDVFDRRVPDALSRTHQLATAAGARTCLLVPELKRLFLAVPHRGTQRAEVRSFELVP